MNILTEFTSFRCEPESAIIKSHNIRDFETEPGTEPKPAALRNEAGTYQSTAPELKSYSNSLSSQSLKEELVLARCSSDDLWHAALQLKLDGGLSATKTLDKVEMLYFKFGSVYLQVDLIYILTTVKVIQKNAQEISKKVKECSYL